ncbi:MAG TPA: DUF2807 domain-containing protein [Rhizomicrobium sp.]|nr:DUF2807 domain-containing protein [Rhizomicrobium sp.]
MRFALTVAVLSLTAAPALATEAVSVGHFEQIQLRGGGHVVVRHGAAQKVSLLKGSSAYTKFWIRDGRELVIDACNDNCPHSYDLDIEIVTPDLGAASIDGGGELVVQGGFPNRDHFAAAVNGGGDLDAHAVSAASVSAAVNGGGDIEVTALKQLSAAVNGGGDITYHGDPQVSEAIRGGGSVDRAD